VRAALEGSRIGSTHKPQGFDRERPANEESRSG